MGKKWTIEPWVLKVSEMTSRKLPSSLKPSGLKSSLKSVEKLLAIPSILTIGAEFYTFLVATIG
jgi:hypothetical protein